MGSELRRMIRDGAPRDWTGPMVHVAKEIADDARDPSQGLPGDGGWPWSAIPVQGCWRRDRWRDGLAERTGMSARSVSRALADLAAAGYEMREPLGAGKDGRVVFTAPGHALRFRVPPLPPREAPERSPSTATEQPANARQGRRNARQKQPERSPSTATPLTQDPPTVNSHAKHLTSPVPVEGARARSGQDRFISERNRQLDALEAWMRQHPGAAP